MKVAPMKGVMHFGKKGKLNPWYVGPFEILDKVGEVAYRLALPLNLASIYNMFNVSMLRKYVADSSHILRHEIWDIQPKTIYEEKPLRILDRKDKS